MSGLGIESGLVIYASCLVEVGIYCPDTFGINLCIKSLILYIFL
jgi:hypothetical protein